jgi:hypothetical protein
MPKKSFKKKEVKEPKEKTPILEKVVFMIDHRETRSGSTDLRLVTWSLDGKPLLEKRDKIKTKSGHIVNGRKPRGLSGADVMVILHRLPEILPHFDIAPAAVLDILEALILILKTPKAKPEPSADYV